MTTTRSREQITLAEGIYLDAEGITILARLGSGAKLRKGRARFPLQDAYGVPYAKRGKDGRMRLNRANERELIQCRLQLLEDLRRTREEDGTLPGTLGEAIDTWLAARPAVKGTPTFQRHTDYRYLLGHWRRSPLAAERVQALTKAQIAEQRDAWSAEGAAPNTCNHRTRVLHELLRKALGADTDETVRVPTVKKLKDREAETRGIDMPIVARIIASMPDRGRPTNGTRARYSETKIRLRVMAWTGLSHVSLMRLERGNVRFGQGRALLPARRKGKGAPAEWVDLLPPALDALRDYDRAGLWGKTFSQSSMRASWRRGIARTRRELAEAAEASGDRTMLDQFLESVPANCTPYDLRHSFLTDYYRHGRDIRATEAVGQTKQTRRYTKAAVAENVSKGIEAMRAHWFPEAPKPAGVVRAFQRVK